MAGGAVPYEPPDNNGVPAPSRLDGKGTLLTEPCPEGAQLSLAWINSGVYSLEVEGEQHKAFGAVKINTYRLENGTFVYMTPDDDDDFAEIGLVEHLYNDGTGRTAVKMMIVKWLCGAPK